MAVGIPVILFYAAGNMLGVLSFSAMGFGQAIIFLFIYQVIISKTNDIG